jgi:hypothetical protein
MKVIRDITYFVKLTRSGSLHICVIASNKDRGDFFAANDKSSRHVRIFKSVIITV